MNFRDRIEQRNRERQGSTQVANENVQDDGFNSDYFGIDNIRQMPPCIDLRLKDGNRKALPYSYVTEVNFDTSEGIEIVTTLNRIKITGQSLSVLYDYLATFRVRYVQTHIGTETDQEGTLVVSDILIEDF